jgi:prepilin-type processing-associated H-X9-DG protein
VAHARYSAGPVTRKKRYEQAIFSPAPRRPDFAINARNYHPGGANTLMGDGSVRFVKSTIDGMVWRELGTVAGGELISSDSY